MNSLISKFSPTVTNMIRMDHTHVVAAFHPYEIGTPPKRKQALANT
ncbi:MAG: hemerythrin protein, partial [Rhizobacter sp.]|nr:hemerythrin protein [Rhizobacter sp.]